MEGLQRIVKQLSNEIIDLNKNSGESTLGRGFFRFPDKKHFPQKPHPPPENINIQDYAMDNFHRAHKDNHSEKDCLAFINMFELFTATQTNPPPSGEDRNLEGNANPTNELSINHFWDLCDFFEGNEEPKVEEVHIVQHTHNTRSRGSVAQTNPSPTIDTNNAAESSQRNHEHDKTVTANKIVNKKSSHANTDDSVELDFSIVEDLKIT